MYDYHNTADSHIFAGDQLHAASRRQQRGRRHAFVQIGHIYPERCPSAARPARPAPAHTSKPAGRPKKHHRRNGHEGKKRPKSTALFTETKLALAVFLKPDNWILAGDKTFRRDLGLSRLDKKRQVTSL